jgi:dynein heavy chain, axonemal
LPWPEEALISTADSHFKDSMNIEDQELRKGLVEIAVDMQMRVTKLRNRYEQELRRYYYVTPTSYLELLSTIKKLLTSRKSLVDGQIRRYEGGINKIA